MSSNLPILSLDLTCKNQSPATDVHHLDLEHRPQFTAEPQLGFRTDTLRIFCYAGQAAQLQHAFRTVRLRLRIADGEHFAQYKGATPAAVRSAYEAKRSLFSWSHLLGAAGNSGAGRSEIRVAAFNSTCVGIETAQPYTVRLHLVRLDLVRLAAFAAGVALFCSAHRLTRMPFFYYSSGVGLGVTLSVFLVVWLIGRQLPRRSMMLGTVLGGWALLWYCLQAAWDNALALCTQYQMYVFYYVCAAAAVSFVACYRIGPPTNERSVDIVRVSLQLAGAALVYASSEHTRAAVAAMLALAVWYYVPWRRCGGCGWLAAAWRRRFPVQRRLLTVEEFEEQAREVTRVELQRMMAYCGSPEAKPWQTVSRLRDPKRFAEFVERGVHVTEEEQFDHTQSLMEDREGEESDEETSDEEVATVRPKQRRSNGSAAATAPEISDDEDDETDARRGAPSYGWRANVARSEPAPTLADISDDDED